MPGPEVDHLPAVDIYDCKGGKWIVVWRHGDTEDCRRNVFCNPGDWLGVTMAKRVFAKDQAGRVLYEVEKPPEQSGAMGISGYQCSWCGKQIFWGTPEDPTNLQARADEHRLECPQRPSAKRKARHAVPCPSPSEGEMKTSAAADVVVQEKVEPPPAPTPHKFKVVADPPLVKGEAGVRPGRTFKKFLPIAL